MLYGYLESLDVLLFNFFFSPPFFVLMFFFVHHENTFFMLSRYICCRTENQLFRVQWNFSRVKKCVFLYFCWFFYFAHHRAHHIPKLISLFRNPIARTLSHPWLACSYKLFSFWSTSINLILTKKKSVVVLT